MRRPAALAFALVLSACSDRAPAAPSGGTVIVAAAADARALIPVLRRSSQDRFASELLFDPLLVTGPSLNVWGDSGFVPRLARRWRWSEDSLAITFELDPGARWHDGAPVVAADVASGFAAIRDPANASALITDIEDIDSVSVRDARTVVVHFRRRSLEQLYAVTMVFPLPAHLVDTITGPLIASGYAEAPVGSGQYRLASWRKQERLELRAVEDHHRGRAPLDRIILSVTGDPTSGLAKLFAGEADVWEAVPPVEVPEAQRHEQLRLIRVRGFEYGFLAFNFRDPRDTSRAHPLLAEPAMRRALAMAIDRQAIARAIFDTLAVVPDAPIVRNQVFHDATIAPVPFDRARAAALLDSLGWRETGRDGIRRRGGARLRLTSLVPISSRNRDRVSLLLQEQWRQVGVELVLERLEDRAFLDSQRDGRFDVILGGFLTTPSARGLRGTWGSRSRAGWGRQNAGRYDGPAFSDALAEALAAPSQEAYIAGVRRAVGHLVADLPAVWLYEPEIVAAVHRRLTLPPWRPDGWWRTLPEWSVDPAQRLPRDAAPGTP